MCRSTTTLLAAALFVSSSVDAFAVHPQFNKVARRLAPVSALYDKEGHHITINPMDGFKGVDLERARVCAEHFGECTVEEMEVLKSNLHKERLQNFAMGGSAMTQAKEDALEHLVLEEELELQLNLLKEHTPDATLFPDDEAEIKAMPHLKDNTPSNEQHHDEQQGFFHKPMPSEILEFEETVLEENLLEPFLICMAIAAIAVVPQFLN